MLGSKLSEIPVKDDVALVKDDADSVKEAAGCSLNRIGDDVSKRFYESMIPLKESCIFNSFSLLGKISVSQSTRSLYFQSTNRSSQGLYNNHESI